MIILSLVNIHYLHCKIGYSRTAAVVGAYLLAAGHASTVEEAIELMRKERPSLVVRAEAATALRQFAAANQGVKKNRTK